jgi:hypothetical protein
LVEFKPVTYSRLDPWIVCTFSGYHFVYASGIVQKIALGELRPRFSNFSSGFSNGAAIAVAEDGKVGAINVRGEWMIPPSYRSIEPFCDGACLAEPDSSSETVVVLNCRGDLLCRYPSALLEVESSVEPSRDWRSFVAMSCVGGKWRPVHFRGSNHYSIPSVEFPVKASKYFTVLQHRNGLNRLFSNYSGSILGSEYAHISLYNSDVAICQKSGSEIYDVIHASGGNIAKCRSSETPTYSAGLLATQRDSTSYLETVSGLEIMTSRSGRFHLEADHIRCYDIMGHAGESGLEFNLSEKCEIYDLNLLRIF